MPALFVSDLDDTLLYRLPEVGSHEVVVDTPRVGAPIGMTRTARQVLERINAQGMFVPVTARAQVTYERIAMPGGTPTWASVASGGVLLHHGEVDEAWREKLSGRAGQVAPLADMQRLLASADGLGEPRAIDGAYVLADILDPGLYSGRREDVEREAIDGGWGASTQHAKVHLFPKHQSKAAVVAEIRERVGSDWVIGAGDSLMDAQMLLDADLGLRPGAGELHVNDWAGPGVYAIENGGTASGEKILRIAEEWLTSPSGVLLLSRRAENGTDFRT